MNCRVCDPCVLYELMKNDPCDPTWTLLTRERVGYTTYNLQGPCTALCNYIQHYSRVIMSPVLLDILEQVNVWCSSFEKKERTNKWRGFHLVSDMHFSKSFFMNKEHEGFPQHLISCSFVSQKAVCPCKIWSSAQKYSGKTGMKTVLNKTYSSISR